MNVLLVEDDLSLGAALQRSLEQAAFTATWVRRLAESRTCLAAGAPAILLLDINLPDGEGFTLLEELRRRRETVPVLIMTARDDLEDRLRGLESGADDYLVKPFAVAELIARMRAILRRHAGFGSDSWTVGDITIDSSRREVRVAGNVLALTPTEFQLLAELARHGGRLVTKSALMTAVWGAGGESSSSALDYHVHALRKKIGHERIRTVRGSGYLLE
jgi:two-component system, OmpR family, response regulator QseB